MGRYGPNLTVASSPSTVDAEALIASIGAEIDGVFAGKGIQVPVAVPPNPAYLSSWIDGFLKRLNAIGVAGVVLQGMFPHATGPASTNLGDTKTSEYRTLLKALTTDPDMIPNGIIFETTGRAAQPRSLWTDGNVDSTTAAVGDRESDPIFTRVTEW